MNINQRKGKSILFIQGILMQSHCLSLELVESLLWSGDQNRKGLSNIAFVEVRCSVEVVSCSFIFCLENADWNKNKDILEWTSTRQTEGMAVLYNSVTHVYMWHDQGKWVTCWRLVDTTIWQLRNATFWCKSHKNWIPGHRAMSKLSVLKTV